MPLNLLTAAIRSTIAATLLVASTAAFAAEQIDRNELAELRRIVAEQRQRIEAQDRALAEILRRMDAALGKTRPAPSTASAAATSNPRAAATPGKASAKSETPDSTSSQERVSLAVSGQVNRGVLYVDDGTNSEVFHVDNDHSSTQFRLVGSGRLSDDLRLGAQIEVQMESNSTGSVSQDGDSDNGIGGASFTERKLEVYFDSKRFGKLWHGQAGTASDGSAEMDLSGTTVIAYSNSPDEMSGGIKFFDPSTKSFGPAIKDVFSNFDGLSRDDRIRYDTPKFVGAWLSASHISGGGGDVALRHAAKYGVVKAAAAIAYADPSSIDASVDNRLNGSVSVLHDSGVNATVALGRDSVERTGSDPSFVYGKLGYIAEFFKIGNTAFAIDYTRAENIGLDGDEATSYGLGVVQDLEKFGTQIYLGVRNHELDRTGSTFDDVLTTLAGARVKF